MKRAVLALLFFVTAALVALGSAAFAQDAEQMPQPPLNGYYTFGKLRGVTTEEARRGAAAATTIPMWAYSVLASRDGSTHTGVMVGRSPFSHGARTTNIPFVIIPVKFTMTDHETGAQTFDPTAPDATCSPQGSALTVFENSPILKPVDFTMPFSGGVNVGSGQYVDEFQRANFWQNVSVTGDSYHTTLSPVTVLSVQSVPVPSGSGKGYRSSDFGAGFCGSLGVLDGQFWDSQQFVGGTGHEAEDLIANLTAAGKIGPTQFPIFLFYNVVLSLSGESTSSCCVLGYHAAQGSPVQTWAEADWDTTKLFTTPGASVTGNSSVMAHEVGEWMDDPLGTNQVPKWGNIGQVSGCQPNLEVGDPLSGTIVPPVTLNGMSYDLQELAFFSWFFGTPSRSVDSTFSDNDTFSSDAGALCSM